MSPTSCSPVEFNRSSFIAWSDRSPEKVVTGLFDADSLVREVAWEIQPESSAILLFDTIRVSSLVSFSRPPSDVIWLAFTTNAVRPRSLPTDSFPVSSLCETFNTCRLGRLPTLSRDVRRFLDRFSQRRSTRCPSAGSGLVSRFDDASKRTRSGVSSSSSSRGESFPDTSSLLIGVFSRVGISHRDALRFEFTMLRTRKERKHAFANDRSIRKKTTRGSRWARGRREWPRDRPPAWSWRPARAGSSPHRARSGCSVSRRRPRPRRRDGARSTTRRAGPRARAKTGWSTFPGRA
mmetsp:Transcript_1153/g.3567  ORF Transcript_1153/g.3567 Transcript_1153/m.3567 type:complete len:293 (+) Transcript_1153:718-1596(+)